MSNNHPSLTVRQAVRDDMPTLVRLLASDPLGSQREAYRDPLPHSYYEAFEAIANDPRHELVVAETDGLVVGTLQLSFLPYLTYQGGMRAQIEAVRVDEVYRGAGIGRYLIEWAIQRARELQCHLVQLTTDRTREAAHRFYEELGFVPSHVGMKLHL